MINAILNGIAEAATGFGDILTNSFEAVSGLFVNMSGDTPTLTVLGTVLVIAIAATVVTFGIRLLLRLLRGIRVSA